MSATLRTHIEHALGGPAGLTRQPQRRTRHEQRQGGPRPRDRTQVRPGSRRWLIAIMQRQDEQRDGALRQGDRALAADVMPAKRLAQAARGGRRTGWLGLAAAGMAAGRLPWLGNAVRGAAGLIRNCHRRSQRNTRCRQPCCPAVPPRPAAWPNSALPSAWPEPPLRAAPSAKPTSADDRCFPLLLAT